MHLIGPIGVGLSPPCPASQAIAGLRALGHSWPRSAPGSASPAKQLLRGCDGVISTRVGWTGGENDNPTEENNSGHAEAGEVASDPEQISYRDLLEFFFQVHRADLGEHVVGSSYRSAVFCTSEEQRKVAEETIRDVDVSGHWPGQVVTEISEASRFWEAQAKDQDYFQRYPEGCALPFPRQGVEAAKR